MHKPRSIIVINWLSTLPDWQTHLEYPCDCFYPAGQIYDTDEEAITAAEQIRGRMNTGNPVHAAACWIEDILSAQRLRNS